MTIRSLLVAAALACAPLTTSALSAQGTSGSPSDDRSATGLVVGVNLTGSFVTVDGATFGEHDFDGRGREGGGGMHFTLGYNFTPRIGVLLHAGGILLSENEDRTFGGVDLALRYSFAIDAGALVPYLEMAIGGFALEDGGASSELMGGGFAVAVGMNLFVTRRFALNADFRYNLGMFTTAEVESRPVTDDAGMGFSASRVNLGFNWFPMAGRGSR